MPKSPDTAPMDYSTRGYLKQQLNKQKIETLDELKKNFCISGKRSIKFTSIKF